MNNFFRITFFSLVGFLITSNSFAQLSIKAELRPRAEFRNGYKALNDSVNDPAFFVSQRTRLIFNYSDEKFKIGISLQDVRVWGDFTYSSSTGVFGNRASTYLNQAWLELFINKYSSLTIGRQYLIYDDQRLLSARNWNQNSLSYDALVYKFKKNTFIFDLGFSLNNKRENIFGNNYPYNVIKTLNFLYLKKNINKLSVSVLAIASGYQKHGTAETIYMRATTGSYLEYKTEKLFVSASGYYQFGKNKTGMDVNAYLLSAKTKYNIWKFKIGAGIDVASGKNKLKTDSSYINKDQMFSVLYGSRHKFYGNMDYFSNLPAATNGGGLVDIFATLNYKLTSTTGLGMAYHFFALQNNVIDPTYTGQDTKALKKSLGSELDFNFSWTLSKIINLKGGYSFMLPTNSLEIIQGIDPGKSNFSSWAWIMLTVKPKLL
ncbi:MAG: alginate export family protein [Bacteroidales bacterium]|nr:alginate export family protein [Bacteroidales bacterium]